MSDFIELPIDSIELDKSNPRIATFLVYRDEDSLTSDDMAMLLGTSADSCAALRDSIRENGGIINPIIVNHKKDGKYIVVEGNTRLQIYRDFVKKQVPGNWTTIRAIVHEDLNDEGVHSIRLQAHLVGTREWDAYAKAKYLDYLANTEHWPMNRLVAFCGGNSKASEIKNMIAAYRDMEEYYRPLCIDDTMFDIKKFHGFVELQKKNVRDALNYRGYTKNDFAKWVVDGKFDKLEHVRLVPSILSSKKAFSTFLRDGSAAAKKILAVEEISPDSLKDVPYDMLAKELRKRMDDFPMSEIHKLQTDAEYEKNIDLLVDLIDSIKLVLEQIGWPNE